MSKSAHRLADRLKSRFSTPGFSCAVAVGEVTMEVPAESIVETCTVLRDEPEFRFGQVADLCGVDYLDYGKADWETSEKKTGAGFSRGVERQVHERHDTDREARFAVVYHLLSHELNQRLRLRVMLAGEPPRVDSVVEVWPGANWFEREAFDLFGILFAGHPDLRRILTDYGFIGHPFRKDFPLIGDVEMRYDPARERVVYEPVSIEPRTLVPKVIRHDERYGVGEDDSERRSA